MPSSEQPLTFGHYETIRELGRGSMGTVYLARDTRIGREVAIKTVELSRGQFEDTGALEEYYLRLQREAEVSGSINHPNVVTLFEAGYKEGRISFLAMEFVDGRSLLNLMKSFRPGPLDIERASAIGRDILSGLACAHEKGIIHRDIKPANILLTSDGHAKIADFGIARPKSSSITVEGSLIGTPDYMSPEQVRGEKVTPAADLFAFGSLLFEMLTARKPFLGEDVTSTLYNIVHGPTPLLRDDVPVDLRMFIETLLSKKPEYRFGSTAEALRELDRIMSGSATVRNEAELPLADAITVESPPDDFETPVASSEEAEPTIRVPVTTDEPSIFFRNVPNGIAALAIAAAAAPLLIALATIMPAIDSRPTVEIPPERIAEFREKAEMMAGAEALCEEGNFEQCVAAYDTYLERYPTAPAALDGKILATRELDRKKVRQQVAKARQDRVEKNPAAEPETPPSRWTRFKNRVKGLFKKD